MCKYRSTNLQRLRQIESFVYVDVFRTGFKISLDLSNSLANCADRGIEVVVCFHRGADPEPDSPQCRVAEAAMAYLDAITFILDQAILTVHSSRLHKLAEIDEVRLIEGMYPIEPSNDRARSILGCNTRPETSISQETTCQGENEVILIADTGLDKGYGRQIHDSFKDRVVGLYGIHGSTADHLGHGTHICGSAVGNGLYRGVAIMGTAPRAQLVVQSLWDMSREGLPPSLRPPYHLFTLFNPPYKNHGARIHSNSWNENMERCQLGYTSGAQVVDAFVWNHKDMVILWSAGNDATYGSDGRIQIGGQIGGEAAAKNCITVGASESKRPEIDIQNRAHQKNLPDIIATRRVAQNRSRVAFFSSRGLPRADVNGCVRVKPDVVAPGTFILSRNSLVNYEPPEFPNDQGDWCYKSGTS